MDLLNISKSRYTTKAYDPNRKIPHEQFARLLEILRLTPSSINIQPWHFFIAENTNAKERIAKALVGKYAYNAPKVLDSSHTILFCTKADISEQHLENFSVHDKFHRTLILSGFCFLKIAKISLNSSFFPKPIKR